MRIKLFDHPVLEFDRGTEDEEMVAAARRVLSLVMPDPPPLPTYAAGNLLPAPPQDSCPSFDWNRRQEVRVALAELRRLAGY